MRDKCYELNRKMSFSHEQLKNENISSLKSDIRKRLDNFRSILSQRKVIDEFDQDLFEAMVDIGIL